MGTLHEETAERLDQMEAELQHLRRLVRDGASARGTRTGGRRRRTAALVAVVVGAASMVMGLASASTPGHPADVTFIPLSVPHKILSNASVGAGVEKAAVVVGGSTTVPTDATSVQMTVAVKSVSAGALKVYPTDHATSTTADTIGFTAGSVVATAVTEQSPGLASKVSFENTGSANAVVTVTITGYSTQTTASNISGSGGTAGQVLTNTGSGAAWAPAVRAFGAASNFTTTSLGVSEKPVVQVTVPAGTYHVTFDATLASVGTARDDAECTLYSPSGSVVSIVYGNSYSANEQNSLAMQGLVRASASGTVVVKCADSNGTATIFYPSLIAVGVGSASGSVVAKAKAPEGSRGASVPR